MFRKPSHILISADLLEERHIQAIVSAVDGWATWKRIGESTSTEEFRDALAMADIMVGWAKPDLLLQSPVRLYLCGSAGYDAYEGLGLNQKSGFVQCSAKGTMSVPIAEHALAMMLFLVRRLQVHALNQGLGQWRRLYDATELAGSTVCIVGMGDSGAALARRCRAFDMEIVGIRKSGQPHPLASRVFPPSQLAEAVSQADHVVACLPGGKDTSKVFNERIFAAMKRGASFYALSRGSTIDFDALTRALQEGRIGGAGLDVTDPEPLPSDHPLRHMPNVLITSHSAGWSKNLSDRLCRLFVENLVKARNGDPLVNVIQLKS